MGWWWTSSSRADEQTTSTSTPPAQSQSPTSSQNPPPSSNPKPARDEDAELREFLASIDWNGDSSNQSKKTAKQSQAEPTSSTSNPNSTSTSTDQPPSSISPESLYPDEMSCRSAFDYAFFCQSFGGQWVNLYRYGELRSCSEHWENFWLCMKARGYSDESRRQTIRDHYRKKAIKYKTGPSSEDVWEVRLEPVKDPFKGNFAAFEEEMKKQRAGGSERS